MLGSTTFVAFGHPLYTHTHSYIHFGFVRAFAHLGWTTHWVNDDPEGAALVSSIPPGSLILTEGQVDQNLPVRSDCYYLLHHCNIGKYRSIPKNHVLCLDINLMSRPQVGTRLSDVSRWTTDETGMGHLFTCWATDLLPHEIEQNMTDIQGGGGGDRGGFTKTPQTVCFIGYMNACPTFGNQNQIMSFVNVAVKAGYHWICHKNSFGRPLSNDQQYRLIREATLAPAIVGHWQQREGYIPCRIFKNISYGSLGITNSAYVQDLSHGRCIFDSDSAALFALSQKNQGNVDLLLSQMEWVRQEHTYIHRIQDVLKAFDLNLPSGMH